MKEKTRTRFDKDPSVDMIWPIGAGGNGECYVLKMGDHYRVLKILIDESGRGMDIESTALENYPIPFMPSIYDKSSNYEGEERYWILIDYIPGPTLRELTSGGFVGYRTKKLIMLKILICLIFQLSEMNKLNLKHRDLKPDNIIIDANLVPHIIDWGDATTRNSLSLRNAHGTIPFTAPEVFDNVRSTMSDIYSFGGVIFNMITEHFPYDEAYQSREGLNNYITDDTKVPSDLDDCYEILNDESLSDEERADASQEISSFIEPILERAIRQHKVDTRFIIDEDFLADKLNTRLSNLIHKCWEFDYKKRISHDEIVKFLDETAQKVLSPDELKEYEDYCDHIALSDPGTEYGTFENIKATFYNGLYQVNATLKTILSDLGYNVVDDGKKFCQLLQSASPFVVL